MFDLTVQAQAAHCFQFSKVIAKVYVAICRTSTNDPDTVRGMEAAVTLQRAPHEVFQSHVARGAMRLAIAG
jgi:hypothetical protein